MTTKLVELTFFSGTYNTIWEPEYPTDDNGCEQEGDINFEAYLNILSTELIQEISTLLPFEFNDLTLESVTSPKAYNFSSDRIFCNLTNYHNNINLLRGYAEYYKSQFQEYLNKHFTSYDGFSSYYDNDYSSWIEKSSDSLDHIEIGTYLSFYLTNESESYTSGDINYYIYCSISSSLSEWIYSNFDYDIVD